MNTKLALYIILAVLVSPAAAAKIEANGIYKADWEVSHAPPATTYVLVEPNGDFWATNFYLNNGPTNAIAGKMNTRSGNGSGVEYVLPFDDVVPPKLRVRTTVTVDTIQLFIDRVGVPPPDRYYDVTGLPTKPLPFNHVLQRQVNSELVLPSGVYAAVGNTFEPVFSITVIGDAFIGSEGNCSFRGKLQDTGLHYRKVTLTYVADCYLQDGTTLVSRNTKLQGVLFGSSRLYHLPPYDGNTLVLIVGNSTGRANFGFARQFLVP